MKDRRQRKKFCTISIFMFLIFVGYFTALFYIAIVRYHGNILVNGLLALIILGIIAIGFHMEMSD